MNSHTTKKFLRTLLSSFHCGYFLCQSKLLCAKVYPIADFQKTVSKLITEKKRVTLWVAFTHGNAISQKALSSFNLRIFPFSPLPSMRSKYLFAESKTTVLVNCSKKGRVELCVMKSHIRKQSLKQLISSYYLRIFPFSQWAPMGSQISLGRIHDNRVIKLFQEGKGGTVCDEVTHQKAISQTAYL